MFFISFLINRSIFDFFDISFSFFNTFSAKPKLQKIQGQTIYEKVKILENAHWECNTDIEAVFTLILKYCNK
ncbi:DUF7788 domain-containing protein [Anaerocellum diazotrophicum]|uniref:DUF7788 domain-containing protein n=1 Tax=Caldicellulosiruptor diazotrophicus TaxID=2806205 RepID=UPI001EE50FE0|nr:DUF2828 family protein [Caldicellulosiruptor diazotrophicus]